MSRSRSRASNDVDSSNPSTNTRPTPYPLTPKRDLRTYGARKRPAVARSLVIGGSTGNEAMVISSDEEELPSSTRSNNSVESRMGVLPERNIVCFPLNPYQSLTADAL